MGERTWPEGVWPTPEQWVAWFLSSDDGGRVAIAGQVIDNSQTASRCFVANHEGAVDELVALRHSFAEQYAQGWDDALAEFKRRYDEANALEDFKRSLDQRPALTTTVPSEGDESA